AETSCNPYLPHAPRRKSVQPADSRRTQHTSVAADLTIAMSLRCSFSATGPCPESCLWVFSRRMGATYFLGASEWLFGALLFAGFWNKKLGILRALGMCFSMISTSTIIPFIPDGWTASAGGFSAMTERVAFLMKDTVLFGVSFYLLRQDVLRASLANTTSSDSTAALRQDP